jgi:hypothetical protein
MSYRVFGLCPSSGIIKTIKHNFSETGSAFILYFLVFRIPDDGQSPKTQYTPSSESFRIYMKYIFYEFLCNKIFSKRHLQIFIPCINAGVDLCFHTVLANLFPINFY